MLIVTSEFAFVAVNVAIVAVVAAPPESLSCEASIVTFFA
jgi:hypothetical protein